MKHDIRSSCTTRGGYREIGKLDTWNLLDFYGFASQGFVVLASQYRGNDGGEGLDEVGGADVGDVMALSRMAAQLPYADPANLFLYGLSRGGMMSFLVLKRGFPARAAAVVGAIFDGEAFAQRAPKVIASIHGANDQDVPATEAMTFAAKRAQRGKRYAMIVYVDDIHEAVNNHQDRDARIGAWFETTHASMTECSERELTNLAIRGWDHMSNGFLC